MMTTATTMTTTATTTATEPNDLLAARPILIPQVNFPKDPRLVELPRLFDPEWIWEAYCRQFGRPDTFPYRIRIRQFAHSLGRIAIVSYEMEWHVGDYIPTQLFAVKIEYGKPVELFRYPEDPRLPGLSKVADPETALVLMNRHVWAIPTRRAKVQLIRYRPASRAVLRHSAGRVKFYVRVMRPNAVPRLLNTQELIGASGFVVPRLAGCWEKGGVVWFSEIPGKNLRRRIQLGKLPDPSPILDGLQTLWRVPLERRGGRPFNLSAAYERAKRSFTHNVRDNSAAQRSLNEATKSLDPFVQSWRPTGIAHNDFYDDQMLALSDGRIALVDFEEAGPGDSMLDVGNFLAHLRWASRFGRRSRRSGSGAYYQVFRSAALERFRWGEDELGLREAVCLFRICTNVVRRPQQDWDRRLEAGLSLVNETLG